MLEIKVPRFKVWRSKWEFEYSQKMQNRINRNSFLRNHHRSIINITRPLHKLFFSPLCHSKQKIGLWCSPYPLRYKSYSFYLLPLAFSHFAPSNSKIHQYDQNPPVLNGRNFRLVPCSKIYWKPALEALEAKNYNVSALIFNI